MNKDIFIEIKKAQKEIIRLENKLNELKSRLEMLKKGKGFNEDWFSE